MAIRANNFQHNYDKNLQQSGYSAHATMTKTLEIKRFRNQNAITIIGCEKTGGEILNLTYTRREAISLLLLHQRQELSLSKANKNRVTSLLVYTTHSLTSHTNH